MATQGPPKPPGDDPPPAPDHPRAAQTEIPVVGVVMQPPDTRVSVDSAPTRLWSAMRDRRIDFDSYARFINAAFVNTKFIPDHPRADVFKHLNEAQPGGAGGAPCRARWLGHGLHAYDLLKIATEVFLLLRACVAVDLGDVIGPRNAADPARLRDALVSQLGDTMGTQRLPYIRQIIDANIGPNAASHLLPFGDGVFAPRADCPCFLELIWSYWHEEGMLVQSLNALSLRFQNRRTSDGRDPLANLELSPLRPLSAIFWGYVQDEQHRLSLARRNYEYEHEYGISLRGKAVPAMRVADRRSRFIEAFHNLLHRGSVFFQQSANLQFNPDPFPLLNGLKEVHLVLSQGAGNQFGDLPWTARVEMLMQQWILARPEIGEFLGRRPMVVYPEAWMGNAETLKTMMHWTDTSIIHFHNLAVFGEQLLMSIRWHTWNSENDAAVARDWANLHRPEIQGYIEAYRVATGVDLSVEPKDGQIATDRNQNPAVLLERKLDEQRRSTRAS